MSSQSDLRVNNPDVDNTAGKTTIEESESHVPVCDWTDKAERKLRRKSVIVSPHFICCTNILHQN